MTFNENEIKLRFGLAIRKVRIQKDYSQEKLAEKCGLHRTYISEIERGERNISLVNIAKLCHALDIRLSQLHKIIEEE